MTNLGGVRTRIVLAVLACAVSLAAAASTPPPTPSLPDANAFVEAVRSGALDAENFDFDGAGFFRMTAEQRMQWQRGVFDAVSASFQPGFSIQCSAVDQRNGTAMAWAQIAGQSADADEWKATVRTLRARLAELDQMLKRSAPEKPNADPLVQELQVRFARDQDVRSIFSELKWTEGLSPVAANNWIFTAGSRMGAIDCDNTAWLKAQLARIGWFTIPKYGEEADSAAWHMVQHADRDPSFQREMLDKLQALPPGQTNGKRLGYLFDRVARAEGRLQRYGTQGQCKDGKWTPYESEDPANLDQRRTSLGMEPIAEHMELASRMACPH